MDDLYGEKTKLEILKLQNASSSTENLLKLLSEINKEEIENYNRKIDSLTKKCKSIPPLIKWKIFLKRF